MEISKVTGQLDTSFMAQREQSQKVDDANVKSQAVQQGLNQESGSNEENLNERLSEIVEELNKHMDSLNANVKFGYSDKINSLYVSVTEKNTGREIRQIPSEEAMRLAEHFRNVIGTIFNKEI